MQHSLHKELVNKDTSLRVLPHEKGCAVKQTGGSIPVSYTALVSENASTQTEFQKCLYPSFSQHGYSKRQQLRMWIEQVWSHI